MKNTLVGLLLRKEPSSHSYYKKNTPSASTPVGLFLECFITLPMKKRKRIWSTPMHCPSTIEYTIEKQLHSLQNHGDLVLIFFFIFTLLNLSWNRKRRRIHRVYMYDDEDRPFAGCQWARGYFGTRQECTRLEACEQGRQSSTCVEKQLLDFPTLAVQHPGFVRPCVHWRRLGQHARTSIAKGGQVFVLSAPGDEASFQGKCDSLA